MVAFYALLGVICVERVAELVVSQRHAAASLRAGGLESGVGHFPVMVALHAALLAGCVLEPVLPCWRRTERKSPDLLTRLCLRRRRSVTAIAF